MKRIYSRYDEIFQKKKKKKKKIIIKMSRFSLTLEKRVERYFHLLKMRYSTRAFETRCFERYLIRLVCFISVSSKDPKIQRSYEWRRSEPLVTRPRPQLWSRYFGWSTFVFKTHKTDSTAGPNCSSTVYFRAIRLVGEGRRDSIEARDIPRVEVARKDTLANVARRD